LSARASTPRAPKTRCLRGTTAPAEQAISNVGCSQLELAVSIMPIGDMILFFVTEVVIESKTDSYIMTVCLG